MSEQSGQHVVADDDTDAQTSTDLIDKLEPEDALTQQAIRVLWDHWPDRVYFVYMRHQSDEPLQPVAMSSLGYPMTRWDIGSSLPETPELTRGEMLEIVDWIEARDEEIDYQVRERPDLPSITIDTERINRIRREAR